MLKELYINSLKALIVFAVVRLHKAFLHLLTLGD